MTKPCLDRTSSSRLAPWLIILLAACGSGADAGTDGDPSVDAGGPDAVDANMVVAPSPEWANVTSNLAGLASECGNLTLVSAGPNAQRVIAGVAQRGLYATTNGGASWSHLGDGAGSDVITNRPLSIVYLPGDPDVFWESGIYNGGGVYRTIDGGSTFEQLGNIGHNDVVSVDLADPARATLLAGGHEQSRTVYRSSDGGHNWVNVGANLPNGTNFSSVPHVIDDMVHLVGVCGWGSGECGIWRTINGGATWSKVSDLPGVYAPRRTSDGTLFWPLNGGGLARSTDDGQTWQVAVEQTVAAVQPVALPDGQLVSIGGDRLLISSDGGDWAPIGKPLPYQPAGLTYSDREKTFYIWRWDCGGVVLPDAIMRAGFDYLADRSG